MRAVLLSLSALLAAVGALLLLGGDRAPGGPRGGAAGVGGYRDSVESRNAFRRTESAEAIDVQYGFIDHEGESHDVTCRILRRDHQRLRARFGYVERDVDAAVNARQEAFADEALRDRGLAPYFRIEVGADSVRSRSIAPPGLWSDLTPERREALLTALKDLRAEVARRTPEFEAAVYQEHGLRLDGNQLEIDYPRLVDWSGPALDACAKALRWAGAGYDDRQYLGMFVAFVQEIRYVVPPDVEDGRQILGLWVPTEVLVNDHGDCDSKAVTFCALWRAFASPMIVVILPRHVLVGVAMAPGPGQQFVRLGNRYYVLCEVAGPGKSAPGEHKVEGSFRYMTVDPSKSGT
jgi:hypothetical protein